jgi:nitrate/nitrite transporter NarK
MTHNNTQENIARRIVLMSGFAMFIIFGIRLSFAVFFAEFVAVEGWSNEASAGIFSASMLVFAFGSTPAGILLDRYGPRIVFTSGVLLISLGLFLSSRVNTVEELIITYGVIGGAGLAIIGLGPIAANISAWFPPAARGRAIGVAFAGTGLGSLTFVPLTTWLIAQLGWRNAYVVLSLICLLILAPLLIMIMRRPPDTLQKRNLAGDSKTLFRNPLFWLLMLVSLTALGPLRSLTVHQIAYIESTGIERQTAAAYIGFAGFLTAGTFIMWGWVSDRFGRGLAFTLGALCLGAAVGILFLLPVVGSSRLLILYAILLALGEGTRSSQTTALASDIFQNSGLGLVNGIVGAMFGLGAAFGPWIVGRFRDSTGSYTIGFFIILVMTAISMFAFIGIILLNRHTKRKGILHDNS